MTTEDALRNPAIRKAIERANAKALPLFDERGVFSFEAYGDPVAQGSKVPFVTREGKAAMREMNPGLDRWRGNVRAAAQLAMGNSAPVGKGKPLLIGCVFRIDREKKTTTGARRAGAGNDWPVVGQDFDKLVRAVNDALTGTVFHDDAQVVGILPPSYKRWTEPGERPGVTIRLCPLGAAQRQLLDL
jgi:Holliday junction resolvase RusA-like endonuclease